MPHTDFSHPTRLSWRALFCLMGRQMVKAVKTNWSLYLLMSGYGISRDMPTWLLVALLGVWVVLFGVVKAILLYRHISFWVDGSDFVVQRGIFEREVMNIPMHRVLNVRTEQDMWLQWFRLYALQLDTLGSDVAEVELLVDAPTANDIRELFAKMSPSETQQPSQTNPLHSESPLGLVRYSMSQLFVAAMSRNHIKGLWLFVVMAYGVFNQLSEELSRQVLDSAADFFGAIHSVVYMGILALVVLGVSIGVHILYVMLTYYGMAMWLYADRLTYRRGSYRQINQEVWFDKVPVVRQTINQVEKMVGVSSVQLVQDNSTDNKANQNVRLSIPGYWQTDALLSHIYPDMSFEGIEPLRSTSALFWRSLRLYGILPLLGGIVLAIYTQWVAVGVMVVWMVGVVWSARQRYQRSWYQLGERYLRLSSGVFGDVFTYIRLCDIQHVAVRQTYFQRRRHTASVAIHTRWRTFVVPYIPHASAVVLTDTLLYKVEKEAVTHRQSSVNPCPSADVMQ